MIRVQGGVVYNTNCRGCGAEEQPEGSFEELFPSMMWTVDKRGKVREGGRRWEKVGEGGRRRERAVEGGRCTPSRR